MDSDRIFEILSTDPALFTARFYKKAGMAVEFIREKYGDVTEQEIESVMQRYSVHNQTGDIIRD